MGSHPAMYSVLQLHDSLHAVNLNQNVLNGLKIENKMKKWQKMSGTTHLLFWNFWKGMREDYLSNFPI